ncbi:putative ARM repeat superfamily protein [Tripterygium wilfordii]|uniref:RING-type E3 ubiquitin transferase n=1 Tax=Tripterygium wilfordii TaxID=458696 RepID=A0A7J7DWI4_TRIWF|nr:U-box domain-containing protein 16-like [Tripterygium wilfordii]KAF5750748.1 putative ARM repeat superfamily protein [Tripterygium wilfordii]
MAISPQSFPPRKRRPPVSSFVTPKLSGRNLLQSVLELSREVSSFMPLQFLQKRNSLSIIRKSKLIAILFEELIGSPRFSFYSPSILLCFEEMYIVLQRIKALIEDCFNGCKMWLLMQNESVAASFHELTVELSTPLDVFPIKEFDLNEDVKELLILIRKQSSQTKVYIDPREDSLKQEVLAMLDRIKREIVPEHSKLAEIFGRLGLRDSLSCREEIEGLEDEVRNLVDDKSKSEVVALIGLVRYGKCVLFGTSTTSTSNFRRRKSISEMTVPSDFRCPISLELMRDPVVVMTGQTYDRESINLWIESGHNTCPKTGQTLAHNNLIPNLALKNLIAMWCRQHRIPFETADGNQKLNGVKTNKAALEATKMTASFLLNKLSVSQSMEECNGVVYELRILAKANSVNRACIAEAGAIPLLVRYLGSDVASKLPNLQVNAVTTILNLSILEANKTRIVETDGALNGVIEVLLSGATWEAKGNAAATIFSLSVVHSYRGKLGRKTSVIKGLTDLARDGPTGSRRDAMVAILNLAGDRETVGKLVEGGVVEMAIDVMSALPEEAVTILEALVRRGGLVAIAPAHSAIRKLGLLLREGTDISRESAAATLVTICRKGGSDMVGELAAIRGIERVIWELMGAGTVRARRKAGTLLRILRRWAAGLDGQLMEGYRGTTVTPSRTTLTT